MKKSIVFIICTLFTASIALATPYYTYTRNARTGGANGSLDRIPGSVLKDLDTSVVIDTSGAYFYYLDADSGAAESDPGTIAPDTNGGNKRWIQVEPYSTCANTSGCVENAITAAGNAATATALAANGGNCSDGSYPLGVDANGAVEGCTDASTEINASITTHESTYDHELLQYTYFSLLSEGGHAGNIFVGQFAGNGDSSGNWNVAVGASALNVVTGASNVSLGISAGVSVTSGGSNILIGQGAAYTLTTGSSNIYIGTGSDASANNVTNEIVIGSNTVVGNGSNTTTIDNIYGNGIAGGRAVYVLSDGELGYDTSSIRYKDNVTILENTEWLYDLQPVNYIYKEDPAQKKQYGLIAEAVEEVEPSLVYYKDGLPDGVNYTQLIPVLINEIKRLNERVRALENEL